MEDNTKDKFVFERFGPKGSAIFILLLSALFFTGSYFSISEHYQQIDASGLSMSLVTTAGLKIVCGVIIFIYAIRLLNK